MSLILETMMVDIGSDGKVGGEIEYEVDEFYGLDDSHSKHFPFSSSPGGKFGIEAPSEALLESEWFEGSMNDGWGESVAPFADLESFEFLMPSEAEADAAFAKVLQEQIDAGLEKLALASPKPNKKKRPSPMKDGGNTKKRQKTGNNEPKTTSSGSSHKKKQSKAQRDMDDAMDDEEDANIEEALLVPEPKKLFEPISKSPALGNRRASQNSTAASISALEMSPPPPPAPTDWTEAECVMFEEALVLFGRPQWKHIAQHIQTRNVHQVKAYAKHYFHERGKDYVPPMTEERLQYLLDQYNKNKPQKQKPGRKPKNQQQQNQPQQQQPAQQATPTQSSVAAAQQQRAGSKKPHHVKGESSSSHSSVAASSQPQKRGKTVAADGTIVGKAPATPQRRSSSKPGSGEVIVLNAEEEDEEEIVDIDVDSEHASIDGDLDLEELDEEEDERVNIIMNIDGDEEDSSDNMDVVEYAASMYAFGSAGPNEADDDDSSDDALNILGVMDQDDVDVDDVLDEAPSSSSQSSSEGVYFAVNADPENPRAVIISTKKKNGTLEAEEHELDDEQKAALKMFSQQNQPDLFLKQQQRMLMHHQQMRQLQQQEQQRQQEQQQKKLKIKFKKENHSDPSMEGFQPVVHHYSPASTLEGDVFDPNLFPHPANAAALAANNTFFSQEWLEEIHIPPVRVLDLPEDEVLDIEIRANSEFFEGNTVKTPERYLRIRNHIIRAWQQNRDRYVTKTSIRRGLRDCGDVNAIGRVHQFLELIGAINFNLEAPASCRKQGQETPAGAVAEAMQRMELGKHIGMGPSHLENKRIKMSVAFEAFEPKLHLGAPDLFLDTNASLVIDVHAHLSREASVGLLLGRHVPEKGQLRITSAVPRLLSNVINIENHFGSTSPTTSPGGPTATLTESEWMESVKAYAAKLHLEVVGMYQTRPDCLAAVNMDHYLHFKHAFRKTHTDKSHAPTPFIGVFASSHGLAAEGLAHGAPAALTQWHYVSLDHSVVRQDADHRPLLTVYRRNVIGTRRLPLEQIAQLFNAYRGMDNGVDLSELWSVDVSKSLLDKLFISLSSAIFVSEKEKNQFWEQLRSLSVDGVSGRFLARVQTSGSPIWEAKDPIGPLSAGPQSRSNSSVTPGRNPVVASLQQPQHLASPATSANNSLTNFDIHSKSTSIHHPVSYGGKSPRVNIL